MDSVRFPFIHQGVKRESRRFIYKRRGKHERGKVEIDHSSFAFTSFPPHITYALHKVQHSRFLSLQENQPPLTNSDFGEHTETKIIGFFHLFRPKCLPRLIVQGHLVPMLVFMSIMMTTPEAGTFFRACLSYHSVATLRQRLAIDLQLSLPLCMLVCLFSSRSPQSGHYYSWTWLSTFSSFSICVLIKIHFTCDGAINHRLSSYDDMSKY